MRELLAGRLSSWKAIATYLDCSVRTVRRWERAEGLPVHRHVHQKLGRVFALKTEVDAWRETRARRPDQISRSAATHPTASVCSIAVLLMQIHRMERWIQAQKSLELRPQQGLLQLALLQRWLRIYCEDRPKAQALQIKARPQQTRREAELKIHLRQRRSTQRKNLILETERLL